MSLWSLWRGARTPKPQPRVPDQSWRARFRRFARAWILPFALAGAILAPFRASVADWNDVPTGSMEPTILPGDRIVVNKLAYGLRLPFTMTWASRWATPRPGDIVILFSPLGGDRLVKRVVALAGDVVEMRDNVLYINGKATEQEGLAPSAGTRPPQASESGPHLFFLERLGTVAHAVMQTPDRPAIRDFDPYRVPEGNCFVMGDNRDNSADSRVFGPVRLDRVVGRVFGVALSLDPAKHYTPRSDRFFTALK